MCTYMRNICHNQNVNIYLVFFHLTVALKEHDNVSYSPVQSVNSGQLPFYQNIFSTIQLLSYIEY
jgi:hypothetical protein